MRAELAAQGEDEMSQMVTVGNLRGMRLGIMKALGLHEDEVYLDAENLLKEPGTRLEGKRVLNENWERLYFKALSECDVMLIYLTEGARFILCRSNALRFSARQCSLSPETMSPCAHSTPECKRCSGIASHALAGYFESTFCGAEMQRALGRKLNKVVVLPEEPSSKEKQALKDITAREATLGGNAGQVVGLVDDEDRIVAAVQKLLK